ncbi:conserved hypothetical protein [Cupriavidus taiwanensis]|uniref:Uncharacterized protein n=1 Tax=Cupriavidus taiwanensis TaxID=164546 RepID=A0A375B831_9BURK|nr:hypothetical protein [Cupriavidus taiwanensis]SOY39770.1 conserved hypothetical protein [Cupriavidus taiwanensis]
MSFKTLRNPVEDPAVQFTLSYIETIERNLEISYNSQGEPICVPEKVADEAVWRLNDQLRRLLTSDQARASIEASRSFGDSYVQGIGFGHVSDFDAFVKIGFLHAERVIVWDILGSRVLANGRVDIESKSLIVELACNILLLKAVAKLGGIVVLPHPVLWSEKARSIARDLARAKVASAATVGLAMALAAIDEGLPLHPYTLATMSQSFPSQPETRSSGAYSEQNKKFSIAATALLQSAEFSFLRDVRLVDFYRIAQENPELNGALRQLFASLTGMSLQQSRKDLEQIISKVKNLSVARDKAISNYKIEGGIATMSFVISLSAIVASPTAASIMAMVGVTMGGISALRRWLVTPQKDVVVQVFAELRTAQPFALEFPTEIPKFEIPASNIDPNIAGHIASIENVDWTEEAHEYLMTLEEETARRVMEGLNDAQIHKLVNFRQFQQNYISDYLQYVWKSSAEAFWQHIARTFISEEGMLMCELEEIDEMLTSIDMPTGVWATLLRYIPPIYGSMLAESYEESARFNSSFEDYKLFKLINVLKCQLLESTAKEEKRVLFCLWLSQLEGEGRKMGEILIQRLFSHETPKWITRI